ncbi:nucleotide exchange factor GrpE [Candidatus Saccharibacteria bacterium]|nr:nucleotide exchange factor GrpE [Candidatus Saccharibacteria bacterium]
MIGKNKSAAGAQPAQPAQAQPAEPAVNPLEAKVAELTNDLQRTRADFENFRKQIELRETAVKSNAKTATVLKMLPLVDNFALAIATYRELAPLAKTFEKTLTELGLQQIPAIPGQTEFNPDLHEAISMEDGDGEKEIIAEVLRPGYLYEGAVLRPTMVKVTKA